MNRFERVIQILDNAVGGAGAPVGAHAAFWRSITRNAFVAKKVFGLPLITVGDGAGSTIVKALKGELPFGADFPGHDEASFNRMPSGMPPVPDSEIAFIQKWIDEGCLEDPILVVAPLVWQKTNAPVASSRTDDIWFIDPLTGWAVNSDGNIIKTTDGGDTWVVQHSAPGVYLRCVGFANANVGWVGTLTRARRLLVTTDGGANWTAVTGLPANAPVAVCGISVVSNLIVYASGTNRPSDVPRMMKTIDGGATWQAWDMSAHASILIDTFFIDALHGWVVGGKSPDPTPTVRDKLKPVVLETTDGGLTWVNRLAGQEGSFPLGEWGWKIQFVDAQVGFVSLENFHDGAVLKTVDGGQTWVRMKINDNQGNANLEGIGFIDSQTGWVGGWGSEDFTAGFTTGTTDGGNNWVDANEVGAFLNRFRFFGKPVTRGYASGDTVYKYSSDPVVQPALGLLGNVDLQRAMLPDARFSGAPDAVSDTVSINVNVPANAKRLTLVAWDRFGVEIGCIEDECRPIAGPRAILWDAVDLHGASLPKGQYILRLTIDDLSASSIYFRRTSAIGAKSKAPKGGATAAAAFDLETPLVKRTFVGQLQEFTPEERDIDWLRNSLQVAIELELATLPPYLAAYWSIKDSSSEAATSIYEIWKEEMLHFGLACNMLVAIGGTPRIADASIVPKYPGPLPGGVRPDLLTVVLRKLDQEQAKVFMDIEYPQDGPIALTEAIQFATIGDFYAAILSTFVDLSPQLDISRQRSGSLGLFKVDTLEKVRDAIHIITSQGEGTQGSPEESPGDLAHYYRFGEIANGKRLVADAQGQWGYHGDPVPMPETWNVADVPAGGYEQSSVPNAQVWNLIQTFDEHYSEMLRRLELVWVHGNSLGSAIAMMQEMAETARDLVTHSLPGGSGNYGPCFRYVPAATAGAQSDSN